MDLPKFPGLALLSERLVDEGPYDVGKSDAIDGRFPAVEEADVSIVSRSRCARILSSKEELRCSEARDALKTSLDPLMLPPLSGSKLSSMLVFTVLVICICYLCVPVIVY